GFISLPLPVTQCPLPKIQHGKRVSDSRWFYRIGDTVSFMCNMGYTLQGSHTSTCQANFRWSPPLPACKRGKCPSAVTARGKAPL
ncbi:CR2 protein, partial [Zapornia atra]|nr:CR2 protein [Zapornia atra]